MGWDGMGWDMAWGGKERFLGRQRSCGHRFRKTWRNEAVEAGENWVIRDAGNGNRDREGGKGGRSRGVEVARSGKGGLRLEGSKGNFPSRCFR